jgi:Cof subfamily protein (haloacid dehalogenase superfamily)
MSYADIPFRIFTNGSGEKETMKYKIVFFDIDGTLLDTENRIPADTRDAVRTLKENGIRVAIATGRAPYHLRPIAEELQIDTYIGFNGSYVVADGKLIYANRIATETLATLSAMAEANGHPMVYLSAEACFASAKDHPHVIESFRHLRLTPPDCRPRYWEERDIFQAFLYCEERDEQTYLQQFHDVSYVRWHPLVMDILPPKGSKARGIEVLLRHYGLAAEESVAFGDGLNDREMLAFVGMGVAMGNAHDAVKPFADMTTRHVNEGGIRYGLQQLGLIG